MAVVDRKREGLESEERNMRKSYIGLGVIVLVALGLVGRASAAVVIFSDNFNRANGNLDTTPGAGELGGLLSSNVVMRSQSLEQLISGDQLDMQSNGSNTAAVRFNNVNGGLGGSPPDLWNFASGAAGTAITAAGGMIISFNWTPPDTSNNWISYSAGISDYNQQYSVVNGGTDSGIILEDNGTVQQFQKSTSVPSGDFGFSDANPTHQVSLEYLFNSFADGSPVSFIATVDGTVAATQSFTWNGNSGANYMELDTNVHNGQLIGNLTISTVPEPTSFVLPAIGLLGLLGRRCRDERLA